MSRISSIADIHRGDFGDSLQLTNWILDSGATCHMTPDISDFLPDSWRKQLNISKFHMGILSHQNKQDNFK